MKLFLALFFATSITVAAQSPQVPHKLQFAGMTLTIRDDARREIQKDVNALTQSPRHHNIKVERAKTYFPIIEEVFAEERVPDDFKYLVLQESALIADAVSTSNAVGFWQFKDFTAAEMGLRVDKVVDERLNIVSSTRAAARYIKKNNFYFNNWLYALQAYQMGAGGVLKSVSDSQSGVKHMEITSSTYWYVKKFLAHKIDFENDVKGKGTVQVVTYETHSKKPLADIASEISVSLDDLSQYNKWAKTGVVPDDKPYSVLIPVIGESTEINLPAEAVAVKTKPESQASTAHTASAKHARKEKESSISVNGIEAILAKPDENPAALAARAEANLSSFLKWNDISISDRIQPGEYYLLGKKRSRSTESYHKVTSGESLWSISQKYGLQLNKLKKYNRVAVDRELTDGMVLWLSSKKPAESDEALALEHVVEVDKTQSFSWAVNPEQTQAALTRKPIISDSVFSATDDGAENNTTAGIEARDVNATNAVGIPTGQKDSVISVVVPPVKNDKKVHIVVAGETLYGIANQYNVGVMDLVAWNNLDLKDGIRPGQAIKLVDDQPVAKKNDVVKELPTVEHEVKATDTLYSVARKYNVTIQELMEWNSKKDFNLVVGEKLRIQPR
jgi:membrane-bound lytic murein transglycosylase D